jgi:hypothetical protein
MLRWAMTILGAKYAVSWAIRLEWLRKVPVCQDCSHDTSVFSFRLSILFPQSGVHFNMARPSSLCYGCLPYRLTLFCFRFGDCRDQGLIVCHFFVRTIFIASLVGYVRKRESLRFPSPKFHQSSDDPYVQFQIQTPISQTIIVRFSCIWVWWWSHVGTMYNGL